MLRFNPLRALGAIALLSMSSLAWAAPHSTCDVPFKQDIKKWPFDLVLEERPLTWSAKKSANELFRAQGQYFASKTSPFLNGSGIPALGFYQPGISLEVEPRVSYSRTVDGRSCMTIVGATIKVIHAGNIELAKELVERSCVARQSMSHQMTHHEAVKRVLKELLAVEDRLKVNVFDVYATKGAAGRNERELIVSLKTFNEAAKEKITALLGPYVRRTRASEVETLPALTRLASTCDGQFERAIALARKAQ